MPKEISIKQNTTEWKLFRRPRIGASDIPAIKGISPWVTSLQLFEEKVFGKERPINNAMKRGTDLEDQVRLLINQMEGKNYQPQIFQSDEFDWAIASLDCSWRDEEGKLWTGEIKVPGEKTIIRSIFNQIPDHYMAQCQWQIYVANPYKHFYAVWDRKSYPYVTWVDRDENMIKDLKSSAIDFKRRLVEFDPPEPSDRDIVKIDDPEAKEWAILYMDAKSQIKNLEEELEVYKKNLEKIISHPRNRIGEFTVNRILKKGTIDYGKIPELKSVDLEKYRKNPTSYINVTKRKSNESA